MDQIDAGLGNELVVQKASLLEFPAIRSEASFSNMAQDVENLSEKLKIAQTHEFKTCGFHTLADPESDGKMLLKILAAVEEIGGPVAYSNPNGTQGHDFTDPCQDTISLKLLTQDFFHAEACMSSSGWDRASLYIPFLQRLAGDLLDIQRGS